MSDYISRQAAIDAVKKHYRTHDNDLLELIAFDIERLPPAQGKPFNLPKIYIADGYDTIEGEDGNVGFGVYVPDENQIYVAGDVEGEIRARALLHEICHWVQAMCGRPFDEDEANEFSDIVYDALPSAQPYTEAELQKIQELEQAELEKAFELGKAEANKWIPCSERLPEDEYVLISKKPTKISGDKWCVAIAIRTADPRSRKIQWRDSGFGVIQDDKVLAWMPLPEPYIPEGEEHG